NDVPGPSISINNISVSAGEQANFTVSLSEPAGRDFELDYNTFDISAVAGQNYVGRSGTLAISQGSSSASLSFDTVSTGQTEDLQFYVLIGSARDGNGNRYGIFNSQVGVATITPAASRLARFDIEVPSTASVCNSPTISVRALDGSGQLI
ncbi:MAG: hypothetical protein R3180_16060, partial [Marinobacter sp.]|nr:hypothetical protein [Marinobacter sp.]